MDLPFSLSEPKALILLITIPPVVALGLLSARARPRDRHRITASAIVRSAILLLITLALAGLQWVTTSGPLNVVFLVDESASVSQANRDAAIQYVQHAIASIGPDDRAGVVLFGEDAVVDRALSSSHDWSPLGKVPSASATDISQAIQVGAALFPEGGARRLVLLSDGAETAGGARDVARAVGASGVQISVVPMGTQSVNEVAVDRVDSPSSIHKGQQFDVRVLLRSTSDRSAKVTLLQDGKQVGQQTLQMKKGSSEVSFNLTANTEGFNVFQARVESVDDRYSENNEASTFTIVKEPPRVLIVAGSDQDAAPLKQALKSSAVEADVVAPDGIPIDMPSLLKYDAVVLANASAQLVGDDAQVELQQYVRDEGRGLVMIGGDLSFGAGGYLRTPIEEAMPVSMDVRTSDQRASLAMAFVLDKSGSMGRCHCGGSQQFSPTMRTEFGPSKVEIAKQAIAKSIALLNSSDQVGVVGFDTAAYWLVNLQPLSQIGEAGVQKSLQPIAAQGDTNMFAGLQAAADALMANPAQVKHMILLGDGWSRQSDFGATLNEMKAGGITLSTIGVGEGPGDVMKDLAAKGGGQYYRAEDVHNLPDVLLKETVRLIGSYYVEKPLKPILAPDSPMLRGLNLDGFPQLLGYNSTTLKGSADLVMSAPNGDPLLAEWQYGLGRTVAWTSDAKGRWAADLVRWPQFGQLMSRVVAWTLPQEASPGLDTSVSLSPGGTSGTQDALVRVESVDSTGAPRDALQTTAFITSTGGLSSSVTLDQQAPGVYQGVARGLPEGVYSVHVGQTDPETSIRVAAQDTGLVVPYPSEYRLEDAASTNASALLADLAQLGNGHELPPAQPAAAFTHDIVAQPTRVILWPWLLLAAIVLFPIDVAVRRLTFSWGDLLRATRRAGQQP